MTKNHILIKGIALGVLLMLSPTAQAAGGVDQVLVAYFNKLYVGASPKCTVDVATKSRILAEIEPKCLIRTVKDEGAFISGVKSTCTEASVKAAVDSQVNALCENTAFKADQAKQEQLAKEAAAKQQEAAKQQAAGGAGGGSTAASALQQVAQGLQLYSEMSKKELRAQTPEQKAAAEAKAKAEAQAKAEAEAKAKVDAAAASVANNSGGSGPNQDAGNGNPGGAASNAPGSAPPATDTTPVARTTGGDVAEGQAANLANNDTAQLNQSRENLQPTQAGPAANDAAAPANPDETDPEKVARLEKAKAEAATWNGKYTTLEQAVAAGTPAIATESTTTCNAEMGMGPASQECAAQKPQTAIQCVEAQLKLLKADKAELEKDKEACANNSAQAEKLCSMVRSEKAQNVQKLMSIGATVLSKVTAASDACGTTSDLSKVAQGGMLVAQGACTAMKYRCDISCAGAKKTLESMKAKIAAMEKCPLQLISAPGATGQIKSAISQIKVHIETELTPDKAVPTAIAQCEKHKADIALMGVTALGFLSAFQDAQECKKQLASGNGNAAGKSTSSLAGPQMTTAEYCSMPNNAASLTCKCTNNPGADGCMGSLAKSGVNIGKIGNNGGASAFASAKQNGLGSLDSLGNAPTGSDEPAPGANLSEAARQALGIGTAPEGGAAAGGVAAGSASAEAAKKAKEEEKEKPKFGFFSSLGNMMSGGRKPDQAANAAIRKHEQDQAIKRKLASDQVRAEISTASGKSNFDKIRSRYQQNAASFEQ